MNSTTKQDPPPEPSWAAVWDDLGLDEPAPSEPHALTDKVNEVHAHHKTFPTHDHPPIEPPAHPPAPEPLAPEFAGFGADLVETPVPIAQVHTEPVQRAPIAPQPVQAEPEPVWHEVRIPVQPEAVADEEQVLEEDDGETEEDTEASESSETPGTSGKKRRRRRARRKKKGKKDQVETTATPEVAATAAVVAAVVDSPTFVATERPQSAEKPQQAEKQAKHNKQQKNKHKQKPVVVDEADDELMPTFGDGVEREPDDEDDENLTGMTDELAHTLNNWNVPAWDDLIAGLGRSER